MLMSLRLLLLLAAPCVTIAARGFYGEHMSEAGSSTNYIPSNMLADRVGYARDPTYVPVAQPLGGSIVSSDEEASPLPVPH